MVFTDDQVESIYREYPRKVAKPAALKAIRNALARLADRNGRPDVVAWLRGRVRLYGNIRTKAHKLGEDVKFTPHPATWFNADRFDDDMEPVTTIEQDKYATLNAERERDRRSLHEAMLASDAEVAEFKAWWVALDDGGRSGFVRDVETVDAKLSSFWGSRDPLTSNLFRASCVCRWKRTVKGREPRKREFDNGALPF